MLECKVLFFHFLRKFKRLGETLGNHHNEYLSCMYIFEIGKQVFSYFHVFFTIHFQKLLGNFLKRVELNNGIAKRTKKLFLKTKITTTNNILPVYLNHSSLKCATEILNFSNNGNSIQNRFIELFSR